MENYSWFTVSLEFSYFGNKFNSNYIYGCRIFGRKTTDMLKYNSYFANTLYTMSIPRLYSDNGSEIAKSYVSVKHRIGGKTDNSFYASRTYTLNKGEYEYSLKLTRRRVLRRFRFCDKRNVLFVRTGRQRFIG